MYHGSPDAKFSYVTENILSDAKFSFVTENILSQTCVVLKTYDAIYSVVIGLCVGVSGFLPGAPSLLPRYNIIINFVSFLC